MFQFFKTFEIAKDADMELMKLKVLFIMYIFFQIDKNRFLKTFTIEHDAAISTAIVNFFKKRSPNFLYD